MSIHHKELGSERAWKSTIGLSKLEFEKISVEFGKIYEELKGYSINPENSSYDLLFKTYEDCVFFVSFQLKQGLNFDTLGFVFGTDGANAHRNFTQILKILEITLIRNNFMPKRKFTKIEEFVSFLSKEEEVIIDVSEESIQRPKDKERQKGHYSGKKNSIP